MSSVGKRVFVGLASVLGVGAVLWGGFGLNYWIALKDDSHVVTGAVAVRSGSEAYVAVSGYAVRISESGDRGHRRTRTSFFPRLTTYRLSDGAPVARRQYSELFPRFSYVDTVVRALTATPGRLWVMSSDRATALHAVDPVTLADVIDHHALEARVPALAAGLHMARGSSESAVNVVRGELVFRVNSGAWLSLDPAAVTARTLAPDGRDTEETRRAEPARSNPAVERAVANRPEWLEPEVVAVSDVDGVADPGVSYVVTRSSLDGDTARVRVTRWNTTGPTPVAAWTQSLDAVAPACCQRLVWRHQGAAVLWYDHWLIALDDATGATRWVRRL